MREITFRGLTVNGDWVYGDLTHDAPNSTAYYKDGIAARIHWMEGKTHYYMPVKDETVGQYTGRKDKTDKEIYEGDYGKDEGGNICRIFWNDNSSGFDADFPNAEMFSVAEIANGIEVIGNIYESPNLLVETDNASK